MFPSFCSSDSEGGNINVEMSTWSRSARSKPRLFISFSFCFFLRQQLHRKINVCFIRPLSRDEHLQTDIEMKVTNEPVEKRYVFFQFPMPSKAMNVSS